MAASAGCAAAASAGSTERSPMTPRWHSTKSNAVARGSLILLYASTPATLSSIISSSLQLMSARISSQCSLNSGARFGGAGTPANCTGVVTRVKGVPSAVCGLAEVAVRLDLDVLRDLDAVLGHRPLALERGEALAPFAEGSGLEGLLEDGTGGGGVGGQLLVGGEALVGDQLFAADDPAGTRPVAEPLQAGEGQEPLVLGQVGADEGVREVDAAAAAGTGAPGHVELERQGDGRAHGPHAHAEQRDVERQGLTRALPVEEGAEDAAGDGHAADGVPVARPGLPGEVVDVGGRGAHGAPGPAPVAQEVVAAAVGFGPALAGARPGHVDDVGVVGLDVLELDVQLLPDGGHLVGQEDVARRGQAVDQVEALRRADVDADALLAPVGVLEQHVDGAHGGHDTAGGQSTHGVAPLGVLDLDDLGTPVGQDGGRGRHEGVLGDLEDANTLHDV